MLDAYIDDSGHPESTSSFVLGAFVASSEQWSKLMREWRGIVNRAGISSFHATDCASGHEEFEGWSASRRKKLFNQLIDVLVRYQAVLGRAAGIMVNDYQRTATDETRNLLRDGPLPFTFSLLAEIIAKRASEPIVFVMDKPSKGWGKISEQFQKMRSCRDGRIWRQNLYSLTPGNCRTFPAIETADLLAYETFRYLRSLADSRASGKAARASRGPFVRLVIEKKPVGRYCDENSLASIVEHGRKLGLVGNR